MSYRIVRKYLYHFREYAEMNLQEIRRQGYIGEMVIEEDDRPAGYILTPDSLPWWHDLSC